jgi:hypothetical protein
MIKPMNIEMRMQLVELYLRSIHVYFNFTNGAALNPVIDRKYA